MATFVLVHGGGHGGWCYQFVAKILRQHGHEVYTPTLTGLGEPARDTLVDYLEALEKRTPVEDRDPTWIEAVKSAIEALDPES